MWKCYCSYCIIIFFFKQKTAYEMRISDWSSDVCSSDLGDQADAADAAGRRNRDLCRHLGDQRAHRIQSQDIARTRDRTLRRLVSGRNRKWRKRADGSGGLSREIRPGACGVYDEIGRASCRERVCTYVWISVVAGHLKKNTARDTQ